VRAKVELSESAGASSRLQVDQDDVQEGDMNGSARRVSRREVLRLAGALGGLGLVSAACAPAGAPQAATPQVVEKIVEKTVVVEKEVVVTPTMPPEVKITAHFTFSPTYKPRIEGWTAAFMEHYPYIKVELIFEPWGEWQTKIITLAAAGQTAACSFA
jgi:hypothetical protein